MLSRNLKKVFKKELPILYSKQASDFVACDDKVFIILKGICFHDQVEIFKACKRILKEHSLENEYYLQVYNNSDDYIFIDCRPVGCPPFEDAIDILKEGEKHD